MGQNGLRFPRPRAGFMEREDQWEDSREGSQDKTRIQQLLLPAGAAHLPSVGDRDPGLDLAVPSMCHTFLQVSPAIWGSWTLHDSHHAAETWFRWTWFAAEIAPSELAL